LQWPSAWWKRAIRLIRMTYDGFAIEFAIEKVFEKGRFQWAPMGY